jgi:hypothetical protein
MRLAVLAISDECFARGTLPPHWHFRERQHRRQCKRQQPSPLGAGGGLCCVEPHELDL